MLSGEGEAVILCFPGRWPDKLCTRDFQYSNGEYGHELRKPDDLAAVYHSVKVSSNCCPRAEGSRALEWLNFLPEHWPCLRLFRVLSRVLADACPVLPAACTADIQLKVAMLLPQMNVSSVCSLALHFFDLGAASSVQGKIELDPEEQTLEKDFETTMLLLMAAVGFDSDVASQGLDASSAQTP